FHRDLAAGGMRNVIEAGSDLLRATRELTAGQRLQHQRRDEAIAEEGDFFGFVVHRCFFLLDVSIRRKAARFHANGVWGGSVGRGGGGECGAAAVGSQTAGRAQQVGAAARQKEKGRDDRAGGTGQGQGRAGDG